MSLNNSVRRERKGIKFLATPGMYLVQKYTAYRRQQEESAKLRATERELRSLTLKIDKLLNHIDDNESHSSGAGVTPRASVTSHGEEEECVICMQVRATMQTYPCMHKVVCRKCFVRTIQIAVNQRCLPLRCVVCRTKILKLKQARDVTPLTSSPSRHNVKLPWQRDHQSMSPHSRSTKQRVGAVSSSGGKPFATRAMQPLLIHPQSMDYQPKQAFVPNSSLKKPKTRSAANKFLTKKQVRFATPLQYEAEIENNNMGSTFDSRTKTPASKPVSDYASTKYSYTNFMVSDNDIFGDTLSFEKIEGNQLSSYCDNSDISARAFSADNSARVLSTKREGCHTSRYVNHLGRMSLFSSPRRTMQAV